LLNAYAWFLGENKLDLSKADTLSAHAVSVDPSNAEYYDTRAMVLGRLSRYREALTAIETAIRLQPGERQFTARRDDLRAALHSAPK
jgi:Flp pilus assembly protein TadD